MRNISQRVTTQAERCQNVVLLSLAEMEGPSAFTRLDPLLLMSSPCNRPSESFCTISDR